MSVVGYRRLYYVVGCPSFSGVNGKAGGVCFSLNRSFSKIGQTIEEIIISIIVAISGSIPPLAAISPLDLPVSYTASATSPLATIPQPIVTLSLFVNPNGFAASEHPTILPIIPSSTNVSPNATISHEKVSWSALFMPI